MSEPLAVLVTGARGQLGRDVAEQANSLGHRVTAVGSAELNITDAQAVDAAVAAMGGGIRAVVINCAAHTAVDAAETEPEAAAAVNTAGPAHLA
nr:NAD(P)-dependent oxidoreductase [Actinomycetota bacterium]